jgi:hypothetical protein
MTAQEAKGGSNQDVWRELVGRNKPDCEICHEIVYEGGHDCKFRWAHGRLFTQVKW